MAKTIHDMAVEYGKVNYIVRYTADGEREIDEDTGAEFFEDGANAVLEVIEEAANICFDEEILKAIRNLKGE